MSIQILIDKLKELQVEITIWLQNDVGYKPKSNQVYVIALFYSILVHVEGFLCLLKSEYAKGCCFNLVRSILEASVDINCLLNDKISKEYLQWLHNKRCTKEIASKLNHAKQYPDALGSSSILDMVPDDELRQLKPKLSKDELDNLKNKYDDPKKRFEIAGLIDYFYFYNLYSSCIHNGGNALIERHININDETTNIEGINCFRIWNEKELLPAIEIVANSLFNTWNVLLLKKPCGENIEKIKKIYTEFKQILNQRWHHVG